MSAAAFGAAAAQWRISRLAADPTVHRAFRWLHLHQPQIRQWQMDMLAIPAPPFGEAARAAWFLERFREIGLENVRLDTAGNALGEIGGDRAEDAPVVLLSAHLDTVFPCGTDTTPVLDEEERIVAPGSCDNAAGLSGLLGMAAALLDAAWTPPARVLFAANVGEEGEGDLRGMRHLFRVGAFAGRIRAAIALEGGGNTGVVTRALASRRFRVEVRGPGGHSWTDAGAPNPIVQLARVIAAIHELPLPGADEVRQTGAREARTPRTTLNVGIVTGGTSVNSIPQAASALIDLRSTEQGLLDETDRALRETIAMILPQDVVSVELIGDRPGGSLHEDSSLMATLRAVDRHLGLRTELGLGSTDANIPLSLGVPAIAIGAGGAGGGIHTLNEWYDPRGREIGLRRVLMTLLDTAARTAVEDV